MHLSRWQLSTTWTNKCTEFNQYIPKIQWKSCQEMFGQEDGTMNLITMSASSIPHVIFLKRLLAGYIKASHSSRRLHIEMPIRNIIWSGDPDLWPMTLTFNLDLDILPLDLHAKIPVCLSVHWSVRARHTDRRCQNYYTRHITDMGHKNRRKQITHQSSLFLVWHRLFRFFFLKSQCHTKRRMDEAMSAHPSFGMTLTQAIGDLFTWHHPIVNAEFNEFTPTIRWKSCQEILGQDDEPLNLFTKMEGKKLPTRVVCSVEGCSAIHHQESISRFRHHSCSLHQ